MNSSKSYDSIPIDGRDPISSEEFCLVASKFNMILFEVMMKFFSSKKMLDFLALSCRENENCSEPYYYAF
jgi:hypothetical protein